MVCLGTPEAFMIRSGGLLLRASLPAIAPIMSTSNSEIRRSLTPDFSCIHLVDLPIMGARSADVCILGGRYNPTPLIFTFNSKTF